LSIGANAPDVVAFDRRGAEIRLSAQRGHPAVVYFYPKDGTPGCTAEACAFRDAWTRFVQANIVVIGISDDSPERHQAFLREHELPFALASDPAGAVARAYGVGKRLWGFDRVTFLVDALGRVAHVWPDVDPAVHATEVLAAATQL
jgi:peroxiredoxin Q/BCP